MRDFLGGAAKLRKMQTDFHHWCGKPFGLLRGIEGSKANHQKVGQYYQALAAADPVIDRSDLAAAVVGIQTPSYKALLLRAKTSAIQDKPSSHPLRLYMRRRRLWIGRRLNSGRPSGRLRIWESR